MERDEQLWSRVLKAFFKQPEVPASEFFVTRVMARLDDVQPEPVWSKWLAPVFGVVFATLILAVSFFSTQTDLSADELLATNGSLETELLEEVS